MQSFFRRSQERALTGLLLLSALGLFAACTNPATPAAPSVEAVQSSLILNLDFSSNSFGPAAGDTVRAVLQRQGAAGPALTQALTIPGSPQAVRAITQPTYQLTFSQVPVGLYHVQTTLTSAAGAVRTQGSAVLNLAEGKAAYPVVVGPPHEPQWPAHLDLAAGFDTDDERFLFRFPRTADGKGLRGATDNRTPADQLVYKVSYRVTLADGSDVPETDGSGRSWSRTDLDAAPGWARLADYGANLASADLLGVNGTVTGAGGALISRSILAPGRRVTVTLQARDAEGWIGVRTVTKSLVRDTRGPQAVSTGYTDWLPLSVSAPLTDQMAFPWPQDNFDALKDLRFWAVIYPAGANPDPALAVDHVRNANGPAGTLTRSLGQPVFGKSPWLVWPVGGSPRDNQVHLVRIVAADTRDNLTLVADLSVVFRTDGRGQLAHQAQ